MYAYVAVYSEAGSRADTCTSYRHSLPVCPEATRCHPSQLDEPQVPVVEIHNEILLVNKRFLFDLIIYAPHGVTVPFPFATRPKQRSKARASPPTPPLLQPSTIYRLQQDLLVDGLKSPKAFHPSTSETCCRRYIRASPARSWSWRRSSSFTCNFSRM